MDTEAYTVCSQGHEHWGTAGAAGLFIVHGTPEAGYEVLLQHRSPEVHEGDSWGVPGGALEAGEDVAAGALRETVEELGELPPLTVLGVLVNDHGGWAYSTVVALAPSAFAVEPTGWETGEEGARWVSLASVEELHLHPGVRLVLPAARELFAVAD